MAAERIRIDTKRGFYPIVYVRGFAATSGEREETFYDTYYGYAATSVEKRDGKPPHYLEPIVTRRWIQRLASGSRFWIRQRDTRPPIECAIRITR